MIKEREALNLTRQDAYDLYQDGMTNFESDDKYTKVLGFFQQSVGGKILNEKYNANVMIKDITEDKTGNLSFVDIKSKSRAEMAMSRFADILEKDEKESGNEFDI